MKAKKKWLAILLSVCMVFAMIPSMAFASVVGAGDPFAVASVQTADAGSGTTTYYTSVAEAIENAGEKATVTVLANSLVSGVPVNKNITLNIGTGVTLR